MAQPDEVREQRRIVRPARQRSPVKPVDVVLDRVDRLEVAGDGGVDCGRHERRGIDPAQRRVVLDTRIEALERWRRVHMAGHDDLLRGDEVQPARPLVDVVVRGHRDPDVQVSAMDGDVRPTPRTGDLLACRSLQLESAGDRLHDAGIDRLSEVDPEELPVADAATQRVLEPESPVGAVGVEEAGGHVAVPLRIGRIAGVGMRLGLVRTRIS